jgi:putative membrane protein
MGFGESARATGQDALPSANAENRGPIAEPTVIGTRRTRLANERTYLAWWRSGFAAFAVGLAAGKVVPALTKETRWPYTVFGASFELLGVAFIAYGLVRQRTVDRAIARGEYVAPDERFVLLLAGVGVLLGFGLLALLVTT